MVRYKCIKRAIWQSTRARKAHQKWKMPTGFWHQYGRLLTCLHSYSMAKPRSLKSSTSVF